MSIILNAVLTPLFYLFHKLLLLLSYSGIDDFLYRSNLPTFNDEIGIGVDGDSGINYGEPVSIFYDLISLLSLM
jgi:hypothetical protein